MWDLEDRGGKHLTSLPRVGVFCKQEPFAYVMLLSVVLILKLKNKQKQK
jgi:hypothetical protein